ncbi:GntR family transcriptional regulator [Parachitinimonas caeni]|uniref:GntR family transcriptional regulator n=1 Tax=Parachitinimonas caeni TaxID=3031301 RepID=A0ABT7DVY8_9NEIS|nr:GntR family transcriptional regulator [Parachitinimonas caeni]MDK2124222.1 GntR family transcriptional regulator [Parachitinimonas caeni]
MFKANDPLTEQIAQYLGHQIVVGDLPAGERIQELRIASELSVSRGSVREALLILQRRHLVEILPRRGAVVSRLTTADVEALYELWLLLLQRVAGNMARHWRPDDLPPFHQLVLDLQRAADSGDVESFYDTGSQFIHNMTAFAGNRYAEQVLYDLLPTARRTSYMVLRAGKSELKRAHGFFAELMARFVSRDADGAVALVDSYGNYQKAIAVEAVRILDGKGRH